MLLKKEEINIADEPIPKKASPQPFCRLIYRVFIPYRFLFSLVYLFNITHAVCLSLEPCQNYPPRSIAYTTLSWVITACFTAKLTFALIGFRKANYNFF